MKDPTLSVIIPTYQHANTIGACLQSVFSQTRLPDEVIVVNDGSTDETLAALVPFRNRLTLINQENQGGNAARNRGLVASRGDALLFCDADVVMRPDMLEKMEETLLAHPEAGYVYSGFRFGWKQFSSYPFSEARLRRMNYVHTTSLIRRLDFPGFDPAIARLQDWDVWLTMLERGRPGLFLEEELFSVQTARRRGGISQWRPAFMYRIPWRCLPWMPASMRRYYDARDVIARKHHLASL